MWFHYRSTSSLYILCNLYYTANTSLPCPQMASAWRVVGFFAVVFVAPALLLLLPLHARYSLYPPRALHAATTDTRQMRPYTSAFWCQVRHKNSLLTQTGEIMRTIFVKEIHPEFGHEPLRSREIQPQYSELLMVCSAVLT